ncbi:mannonate dehydratase [Chitinophaga rhizosphaerae]|uniref:mannonate dehydratase n=1 Tax=Chitinophaga rhizosphaerae TaxID=1864947 RepID=UPI002938E5F9|nr:mannonate dehydratase [Chitinophaga rhizosphaerae]
MPMEQTMRWFGPKDPVSLRDIRQAGCTGVVTALHHIPVGETWTIEEIEKRKSLIEAEGMRWPVVESLPVHEDIKKSSGDVQGHIKRYVESLENLARCGVSTVTYNFMPVMDWMRTNVNYELPNGARALYYDRAAFIAFDLFLLNRPGAKADYSAEEILSAEKKLQSLTPQQRETLFHNALLGLPGSDDRFTREGVLRALAEYDDIDAPKLRAHLFHFLRQVAPVAEACGIRLAIHPDDPPYPLLGLPRIVSTEADLLAILNASPETANGICFCTGSLGVRPDNDLTGIIERLGNRIHFIHLRNIRRLAGGDFYEADHLDGDVDMYGVVRALTQTMRQRNVSLPMRPDHGHRMLDDLAKQTYPGYSGIGRLKGLAELRGLEMGILRT